MSQVDTRLSKIETEVRARAIAEWRAADDALWSWIKANNPPAAYDALLRVFYEPLFVDLQTRQDAGLALSSAQERVMELREILGPVLPDDQAMAEEVDQRIPPELVARMDAAVKSPMIRVEDLERLAA